MINILYCMPRSSGDILQSTAICKRIKEYFKNEKNEDITLYFGLQKEYVDMIDKCPWIDRIIEYNQNMDNIPYLLLLPQFDIVFTPHFYTQYLNSTNFIFNGLGKNIVFQFAWHSNVKLDLFNRDEFFVPIENMKNISYCDKLNNKKYILFVTGTGNPASTKHYKYWDEIVDNIVDNYGDNFLCVQGGMIEDIKLKNKNIIDLRGRTRKINEFNTLVKNAELVVTIDSYPMHCAYIQNVKTIALFSCTYSQCSGMNYIDDSMIIDKQFVMLSDNNLNHKRHYKNECQTNEQCINNIETERIIKEINELLPIKNGNKIIFKKSYPTLSGYTTIYNGINAKFPFIESIDSVLPYCDELIVLDGLSDDGTWEILLEKYKSNSIVKLHRRKYDFDIPGIDGQQKAYARALCTKEFCLQFDVDQIFEDGTKFKMKDFIRDFPDKMDLMHFLTIDLFGIVDTIKNNKWYISDDYHCHRFCLSRNQDYITHGINKYAMIIEPETGKIYAKDGMSDGCEYIHVITNEMISMFGPYTQDVEYLRKNDLEKYSSTVKEMFEQGPHFIHLSWASIERKIQHFIDFWDFQWQSLYKVSKENMKKRWFNGIEKENITKEMIKEEAKKLFRKGGCHNGGNLVEVNLSENIKNKLNPWFSDIIKEYSIE